MSGGNDSSINKTKSANDYSSGGGQQHLAGYSSRIKTPRHDQSKADELKGYPKARKSKSPMSRNVERLKNHDDVSDSNSALQTKRKDF